MEPQPRIRPTRDVVAAWVDAQIAGDEYNATWLAFRGRDGHSGSIRMTDVDLEYQQVVRALNEDEPAFLPRGIWYSGFQVNADDGSIDRYDLEIRIPATTHFLTGGIDADNVITDPSATGRDAAVLYALAAVNRLHDIADTADRHGVDLAPIGEPAVVPGFDPRANLWAIDSDGDGLSDAEEHIRGTNPNFAETDGDGRLDGTEVVGGGNPRIAATIDEDLALDDPHVARTRLAATLADPQQCEPLLDALVLLGANEQWDVDVHTTVAIALGRVAESAGLPAPYGDFGLEYYGPLAEARGHEVLEAAPSLGVDGLLNEPLPDLDYGDLVIDDLPEDQPQLAVV